jgi:predicted TIM-barrel fold metal-dependent hydrolase
MTGPLAGSDIGFADPAPIDRVASRFPKLKIVCGHGCWPRVAEMIAVALKHPNVFVSPDVYQFAPGSHLYIEAANGFMADQYLFATAYPVLALKETVERFKALPLNPTALEKALCGNARRLLKLT